MKTKTIFFVVASFVGIYVVCVYFYHFSRETSIVAAGLSAIFFIPFLNAIQETKKKQTIADQISITVQFPADVLGKDWCSIEEEPPIMIFKNEKLIGYFPNGDVMGKRKIAIARYRNGILCTGDGSNEKHHATHYLRDRELFPESFAI